MGNRFSEYTDEQLKPGLEKYTESIYRAGFSKGYTFGAREGIRRGVRIGIISGVAIGILTSLLVVAGAITYNRNITSPQEIRDTEHTPYAHLSKLNLKDKLK